MTDLHYCQHEGKDAWWEYDARGIELAKVCSRCRTAKLSVFRKEILSNPNYEADEAIEEE
jgi:hypothetical protein